MCEFFCANLFFPIEPPSMESAGSYKLLSGRFCIESFAKVWSKSISCFLLSSQHFWGAEDAVSEVTTNMGTASLFLKGLFWFGFFLLAASPLRQNWSGNKVCAAGRLFELSSLPTSQSPPPLCQEERLFLVVSLCTGELLQRQLCSSLCLLQKLKEYVAFQSSQLAV